VFRFNYRSCCRVTALFIAWNKGPKESGTEPAYYLKCTNPTVSSCRAFQPSCDFFTHHKRSHTDIATKVTKCKRHHAAFKLTSCVWKIHQAFNGARNNHKGEKLFIKLIIFVMYMYNFTHNTFIICKTAHEILCYLGKMFLQIFRLNAAIIFTSI